MIWLVCDSLPGVWVCEESTSPGVGPGWLAGVALQALWHPAALGGFRLFLGAGRRAAWELY